MRGLGARARRRRRRIGAAIGVTAVVVAGGAGLVAASAAHPATPWPHAAAFLPADGRAEWVSLGGGRLQQWEHWVTTGSPVLFVFPELARDLALRGYSDAELTGQHWAVLRTDEPNGTAATATGRSMDLYAVTEAGIRLTINLDAHSGFTFAPGVVVLDDAAQPGDTWTTEGDAVYAFTGDAGAVSASLAYRGQYTARAPDDPQLRPFAAGRSGCLEVAGTLTLTASGQADPTLVLDDTSLWCPGEGVVGSVSSPDGGATRTVGGVVSAPALPGVPAALRASVPSSSWSAAKVEATLPHEVYGPTTRALSPALEPVVVGDTLVVPLTNGMGLSFVRAVADDARDVVQEVRLARPGGEVTALGVAGGLVVAATSDRRVVAYRADGVRVWEAPLDDIALAPPTAAAGDSVVVATADGGIRSFERQTGRLRWRAAATPDAVEFLRAAGDRVFAVDRAGGVTAVAAADGTTLWHADGSAPDTATATDDAVYVARDDRLERYDAATGDRIWRAAIGTGADDVVVTAGTAVVMTWDDLVAFDATTGAPRWRAPGGDRLTLAGDAVLVDGGGAPRLLDADGRVTAQWDAVPREAPGAARFVAAGSAAAWIVDSVSGLYRIAP